MSDLQTIREALERYRRIAYQRRYGGLARDYQRARKALAALERVEQPAPWEAT